MSAMSLSSPQRLRLTSAQRLGPMEVDLEREHGGPERGNCPPGDGAKLNKDHVDKTMSF